MPVLPLVDRAERDPDLLRELLLGQSHPFAQAPHQHGIISFLHRALRR